MERRNDTTIAPPKLTGVAFYPELIQEIVTLAQEWASDAETREELIYRMSMAVVSGHGRHEREHHLSRAGYAALDWLRSSGRPVNDAEYSAQEAWLRAHPL